MGGVRYFYLRFLVLTLITGLAISCSQQSELLTPGISKKLAELRKESISSISYKLHFNIPEEKSQAIEGQAEIKFTYKKTGTDLLLDFNADPELIKKVFVNEKEIVPVIESEHLIIDEHLLTDQNSIKIEFLAGEQSLNRKPEYMYTLFVPERASTCFPLFDQPDLKAHYNLSLTVPSTWQAVANGSLMEVNQLTGKKTVVFEETKPISSYLFAFAAGQFNKVSQTINGREMTMYHRETDTAKVSKNVNEIFEWHTKSLNWLEAYTGIDYQFDKMEFVLIPSFQYGGMEHPGSILYKSSSLFLEESATLNQQLGRARLIAHEVSHMWFGNLVTMKWFDDVWLKEVFANFMAAKIVNPEFPAIDHDLKFVMSHYPAAYSVDRTMGTHAIKQELNNLKNAGSLYGAIIYQKAPIVMKMLENNIGEENFKIGMRTYLEKYKYSNATWVDLLDILSQDTEYDISYWNEKWVMTAGMPAIRIVLRLDRNELMTMLRTYSKVPDVDRAIVWPQMLQVLVGFPDSSSMTFDTQVGHNIDSIVGKPSPSYIFTNASGTGYGFFSLGPKSKEHFLQNMDSYDDLLRGALWINYNELLLRAGIEPNKLMEALVRNLPQETNPIITEYMLQMTEHIFWNLYSERQRNQLAPKLEGVLLNMAIGTQDSQVKSSYFNTLRSIVTTEGSVDLLRRIWQEDMSIEGLELAESDYIKLAYALAVRDADAEQILNNQSERIRNPDRKRKFEFVRKALSTSQDKRDAFFESLKQPVNRENEEWVLEALTYLHHPLRAASSLRYLSASLEELEEIKRTGDIFFPKRWLDKTFSGHSSFEADVIVRQFLFKHNSYPEDLKNKILQAADPLFRAVRIKEKYKEDAEPGA